jgi:MFS family permease
VSAPQACYPASKEQRRTLPIAVSPPVPDRSSWIVLAVVSVAQFMVVLDATIVNVALPSLQRDLRFAASDLQRAGTLYTLLFGGSCCLVGALFGRRRLVMAGVAVFSAASRTESATASGRPRAPGADSYAVGTVAHQLSG